MRRKRAGDAQDEYRWRSDPDLAQFDASRPVHNTVLGAGIPLLEHLTALDRLPDTGARLTALPPPVRGMGSFPVRAVAVLPSPDPR